ncbi:SDR family oxidoreductase [Leeia sp. TBRC 13508]|uniref:SDR family oxidoreductase n=1 Tax=Leeia speluncae TaxID=2884804 RepID=A0ABS8D371_9NEIS|nr:SDR family oxidoreductase [Leeia speluncae]MCB6182640.1 SDR family oxidoreductase [Leeia speluncae]
MIAVTGVSGQLGRLVIEKLLKTQAASNIVALVRTPAKVADLAEKGMIVRQADYDDEASFVSALAGVEKLLLISSSEIGKRASQHSNVINAAKKAGVKLIAYTSVLHADRSPLGLAAEHVATEAMLKESGVPYALLRNGWYTENYMASVPVAVQHGALLGAAEDGKIASASREDYAEAASVVIQQADVAGKVFELAGDESYTLSQLAAEIGKQAGKTVAYQNLPVADYQSTLESFGLPAPLANLIANSDGGAAKGGLFDDSRTLSALIGRATTPLAQSVKAALGN